MRMPNLHCKFNVINVSKLYYMKFATEPRKNTRSFRYEPAKTQMEKKTNYKKMFQGYGMVINRNA